MTKPKAKIKSAPTPLDVTIVKVTMTVAVDNWLCDDHKDTMDLVQQQLEADEQIIKSLDNHDIKVLGFKSDLLRLDYEFPT